MSPKLYRDTAFLHARIRGLERDAYEIRLDDVHLALESDLSYIEPVHYIFNTAYCCSTLLARYFELVPNCFVLKEPGLLAQLAMVSDRARITWQSCFELVIRLLTRKYRSGDLVVIKPADSCNRIGSDILAHNPIATITFLMTPLKQFLLSVLKYEARRKRTHKRLHAAALDAASCSSLSTVAHEGLNDAEAAAYLWLAHWHLYNELSTGLHASRVSLVSGDELVNAPENVLATVTSSCGRTLEAEDLRQLIRHPAVSSYSKNLSLPYDAISRRQELAELEASYGVELETGLKWADDHRVPRIPDPLFPETAHMRPNGNL